MDKLFWNKVEKTTSCWLWIGSKTGSGYGKLKRKGKFYTAHRVSWEVYNGPIPKGMLVLHTCDVRNCVNPKHLFLGTHQDNMDDMVRKGRVNHPAQKGNLNFNSKHYKFLKTLNEE